MESRIEKQRIEDGSYDPTPAPCCLHLRCKSMYYRADERPGLLHWSNAMGYWCIKTHEPIGPDDASAQHTTCQAGRTCYEAPPG